jgi:hypothetical protein
MIASTEPVAAIAVPQAVVVEVVAGLGQLTVAVIAPAAMAKTLPVEPRIVTL